MNEESRVAEAVTLCVTKGNGDVVVKKMEVRKNED